MNVCCAIVCLVPNQMLIVSILTLETIRKRCNYKLTSYFKV